MKVIFLKDLKNQGKKGQVKEVKDGYAENFLIKKGYAVIANATNIQKLQDEKKEKNRLDEQKRKEALIMKKDLERIVLTFSVKTGDGDKVFGSVSVKQIRDKLMKEGYQIEKSAIQTESPLASLGFHSIMIELYKDIFAKVKVHLIK